MSMLDFIRRHSSNNKGDYMEYKIDPEEGTDFIFDRQSFSDPEKTSRDSPLFGLRYAYLNNLANDALAFRNANGFTVRNEVIPGLEDDFFSLFGLPQPFEGSFRCSFYGSTGQAAFSISVFAVLPDGSEVPIKGSHGPFLKISSTEIFRLTPAQWHFLNHCATHSQLPAEQRTEYNNNKLILNLQAARNNGAKADLSSFNNLEVLQPPKIGVSAQLTDSGDLVLTPAFGAGIEPGDVNSREAQLDPKAENCVLRVKQRFLLLDEERLKAAEEILTNRRIPRSQVKSFLASPSAYLSASLIDFDTGFSLRVRGATRFTHHYFGDVEKSGVDWFEMSSVVTEPPVNLKSLIHDEETLRDVISQVNHGWSNSADQIEIAGRAFDISDKQLVNAVLAKVTSQIRNNFEENESVEENDTPAPEKAVVDIAGNDETLDFSSVAAISDTEIAAERFDQSNLKRSPYPHQDEGIRWLLAHFSATERSNGGCGALLADDMGLGKTYMTLVAISEWMRRLASSQETLPPVLIVAPLSLMENWVAEIDATFENSPFSDVVILQAGADLKRFRETGAGTETRQFLDADGQLVESNEIRYSLKVGKHYGVDRLDMPARLVLTTYQTLRDYQFSLSRIPWLVVAFDEAQHIKNPNAMATIAAKALKARFKLLATGTPVENSLKDFWCLMDTASPGLLEAYQHFRDTYIKPVMDAPEGQERQIKIDIGRQLRRTVGLHMLRRTKADNLKGLPEKHIYSPCEEPGTRYMAALGLPMKGTQLKKYNQVVESVKTANVDDKRQLILPSLLKLRTISIHPLLEENLGELATNMSAQALSDLSCKLTSIFSILDDIKARNEKTLIFVTSRAAQSLVSILLTSRYGIHAEVINGDTNAVTTKSNDVTRKSLVDQFQATPGFNVIIMSPLAAGTGLTVTGANNVIHLERHWNPAKEAQATDRVYRIGQNKAVNVYLPMAIHPAMLSFDLHLNRLLNNKIDLSDAVVANPPIDPGEFSNMF